MDLMPTKHEWDVGGQELSKYLGKHPVVLASFRFRSLL